MSRIGTMGPRKTKFNPTTNNPFQGATVINFSTRGGPLITLTNPRDFQSTQVKNGAKPFVIVRTKPPNAGAAYGDNSRLEMGIARGQTLTSRIGFDITVGVNNNGALIDTDGIQTISISATDDRGNPIAVFGPGGEEGRPEQPTAQGTYTKAQAAAQGVTLRDGDNFKFTLQQAAQAANPEFPADRINGTLYFPDEILGQLRRPGDSAIMLLTINIDYLSQTTGAVVSLTGAVLTMALYFTED